MGFVIFVETLVALNDQDCVVLNLDLKLGFEGQNKKKKKNIQCIRQLW